MTRPRDPDAVFAALSDPTRRAVMQWLADRGDSTLGEIAQDLPVTRQAVAKHLALLEDAGLVASGGETRRKSYRLTPAPLTDAMDWIVDVGAEWDERLQRLQRHVRRSR